MKFTYDPRPIMKQWPTQGPSENRATGVSYVEDNGYRVSEAVRKASYDQLKRIEAILGLPNTGHEPTAPSAPKLK